MIIDRCIVLQISRQGIQYPISQYTFLHVQMILILLVDRRKTSKEHYYSASENCEKAD